ncbi:MAG: hypothetical protein B6229_00325 [Spirochaetaceae bacterium 4572_7]|nr:MAG: hypothetical protein B6229_00325 [Spirochaetaceae bacterium 4572_7]
MKTTISATIDAELAVEGRLRKVNFSELLNNSLKTYLEMASDIDEEMSLNDKIVTAKARVMSLETEKKKESELKAKKKEIENKGWITR